MRRAFTAVVLFVLALPAVSFAGGFKASKASDSELVACLEDPEPALREDCVDEMGARDVAVFGPTLFDVARNDGGPRVRLAALDALKDLSAPQLPKAAGHVATRDAAVPNRAHALAIIEKQLPDSSAPVVVQAMQDSDATIVRKAIIIAGKRGFSEAEPWLVQHGVEHPDPAVVVQVWKTLTRLGNPDHRPRIHVALAQGTEDVRGAVARAMRDTVLPQDRDALVRALDDANTHVARDASKALIKLGDASVAPILRQKAAEASDESVMNDFNKAATALGG